MHLAPEILALGESININRLDKTARDKVVSSESESHVQRSSFRDTYAQENQRQQHVTQPPKERAVPAQASASNEASRSQHPVSRTRGEESDTPASASLQNESNTAGVHKQSAVEPLPENTIVVDTPMPEGLIVGDEVVLGLSHLTPLVSKPLANEFRPLLSATDITPSEDVLLHESPLPLSVNAPALNHPNLIVTPALMPVEQRFPSAGVLALTGAVPDTSIGHTTALPVDSLVTANTVKGLNREGGLSASVTTAAIDQPLMTTVNSDGSKPSPVVTANGLNPTEMLSHNNSRAYSFEGMMQKTMSSESFFSAKAVSGSDKLPSIEALSSLEVGTRGAPVGISTTVGASQELSLGRVQMPVTISFGKPQWAGMVAERAAMMAGQNIQSAELQLDPPELGPLQVRVQVQNDQVTVSFVSNHANVRDALDQTASRLRELCDQQGMNLVDVDVSDHSQDEQEFAESTNDTHPAAQNELDEDLANTPQTLQLSASSGIDFYA